MSKRYTPFQLEQLRRAAKRAFRTGKFATLSAAQDAIAQSERFQNWSVLMHSQGDAAAERLSESTSTSKSIIRSLAPSSWYPEIGGNVHDVAGLDLDPKLPARIETELHSFLKLATSSAMYSEILLDGRNGTPAWVVKVLRRFAGYGLSFEIYPRTSADTELANVLNEARGWPSFALLDVMTNDAVKEFLDDVPTFSLD